MIEKNKIMNTKNLARIAMISAIYTVISLALAPVSYGMMQVRISEALTLLPFIYPGAVVGVTLGCFLTNFIGVFTGMNILGPLDVLFGTVATFLAAFCTYKLRKKSIFLAALPPIIFNAIVIGAELTFVTGVFSMPVFTLQAAWVGAGQAAACILLGVPLIKIMQKTHILDVNKI